MGRKDELEARVRETPLSERLSDCRKRIGKMCSEGRPPRMCIPVQWDDDDFYISTTLADAQRALDVEREKVKRLSTCGTDHSTPWWQVKCEDLEAQLATLQAQLESANVLIYKKNCALGRADTTITELQAQLRQVEEALQERKEFIADCDTALDRIQAPRTNEGQEELVSTWRRIELLGKLLYQYRQELERSAPTLRAENARLREVLEAIADGPGTNGYCTQYERYMVELAQAALQPERGKP